MALGWPPEARKPFPAKPCSLQKILLNKSCMAYTTTGVSVYCFFNLITPWLSRAVFNTTAFIEEGKPYRGKHTFKALPNKGLVYFFLLLDLLLLHLLEYCETI